MKTSQFMVLLLLVVVSCKKTVTPITPAMYTTISGYVYDHAHQKPLANVNMAIIAYVTRSVAWSPLIENRIVTTVNTNDSGYFQSSIADSTLADSIFVGINSTGLFGTGIYRVTLNQVNSFSFYVDTIPLLYLHFQVINNDDTLDVFPDERILAGDFYCYPVTFDTDVIWPVLPNSTYRILARYEDIHGTLHAQYQNLATGSYQDTFQRTLSFDPSTF